jgi:HPt (histidine-containing phosphotransfer) domain-containing protein
MSDFEARLAMLRQRFLLRLAEDRRALEANGSANINSDQALRTIHRMAGLAGSVGLIELGRAAQGLERAMEAQPLAQISALPEFGDLMAQIEHALDDRH